MFGTAKKNFNIKHLSKLINLGWSFDAKNYVKRYYAKIANKGSILFLNAAERKYEMIKDEESRKRTFRKPAVSKIFSDLEIEISYI